MLNTGQEKKKTKQHRDTWKGQVKKKVRRGDEKITDDV